MLRGTTGRAGGVDDGVGEVSVEEQVALDVCVAAAAEVAGADFGGTEGHGGGEAGAHGALAVGCDEGDAAGVGQVRVFEAGAVRTGFGEMPAIGGGRRVVAQFAEKGCAQAEAGGAHGGVAGGTAGDGRGRMFEASDDRLHLVGIDQYHAPFGSGDGGEERFGDSGEQVHDR